MPATNSGPTTMTISGGNLLKIAAQVYGDATQWDRIAAINGLFDFIVTGTVTLVIPVASFTGAWIETYCECRRHAWFRVASRVAPWMKHSC